MGAEGLARVARACMARTAELVSALAALPGVRVAFSGARFHEAVLLLDRPVAPVLQALAARGIEGGFDSRHALSGTRPGAAGLCHGDALGRRHRTVRRALRDILQTARAA